MKFEETKIDPVTGKTKKVKTNVDGVIYNLI